MANILKKGILGILGLLLIIGLFPAATAAEKLFVIDDVDIDDPYAPGEVIPVEITLENLAETNDVEDIIVRVWLEDDQGERVGDKVKYEINRMHQDSDKEITVNLPLDADLIEDVYTLYVTAEGEWEETGADVEDEMTVEVEIEQNEHGLYIQNVQLSSETVYSGETVDLAVRILNNGQEDESDIKIKVEVPEIGAEKTVSLLNSLNAGYDYTAYLTIDIPSAESGIYTLNVNAYNADAGDNYELDLAVEKAVIAVNNQPTTITTAPVTQTIPFGKGSIFSIDVKNNANVAKTFELVVGGVADWANARVDVSEVTLGPSDSEVAYVYVLPQASGAHSFTLYVKENGATVGATQVNVNVEGGAAGTSMTNTDNLLVLLLIAFVVIIAGYIYKKELTGNDKRRQVYY